MIFFVFTRGRADDSWTLGSEGPSSGRGWEVQRADPRRTRAPTLPRPYPSGSRLSEGRSAQLGRVSSWGPGLIEFSWGWGGGRDSGWHRGGRAPLLTGPGSYPSDLSPARGWARRPRTSPQVGDRSSEGPGFLPGTLPRGDWGSTVVGQGRGIGFGETVTPGRRECDWFLARPYPSTSTRHSWEESREFSGLE